MCMKGNTNPKENNVNSKRIAFNKDEDGTRMLAVFVSQLIREGVVFSVRANDFVYEVELTGGF